MLVFTYVSHPAAIAVCILSSSGGVDGGTVIQQEFFQLRLWPEWHSREGQLRRRAQPMTLGRKHRVPAQEGIEPLTLASLAPCSSQLY